MRRLELMGAQPRKSAITAALATAQAGVSESPMQRIFPSRTRSFSAADGFFDRCVCWPQLCSQYRSM
jgi:hypothetical protein